MKLREAQAEVAAILNDIVDPCSVTMGMPIGLSDMGIIERVEIRKRHVRVFLTPTFPGCLYLGVFEREIVTRLMRLRWCESVSVEHGDGIWDETRMTEDARQALRSRRQAIRGHLGLQRGEGPAR